MSDNSYKEHLRKRIIYLKECLKDITDKKEEEEYKRVISDIKKELRGLCLPLKV